MATVNEKVKGFSRSTGVSPALQYFGRNPLAVGLIGAGVALLVSRSRRRGLSCRTGSFGESGSGTSGDYYQRRYESGASGYATDASQRVAGLRDKAKGAAAKASRQTRNAGQQLRNTAQSARGQAASAYDRNPLLLGLAALAAGAVVGLLLPSTELEGEYMGGASEQLMDRAKSTARDTADRAQRAAQDTGRELKQKAKEALGVSQTEGQPEPQPATY